MDVPGILLLYHHPLRADAPTIREHVDAWEHHSRFPVYKLNTRLGFPRALNALRFQAVVLHYSLFGSDHYMLAPAFLAYLKTAAYKVAFFQDEYYYCRQRFAFIDDYALDCVFTLLDPVHWPEVYQRYTRVPKLVHTLTGYVSQEMVEQGARLARPTAQRPIDLGYRARALPYYMGRGAQEKAGIADGVKPRARELGLKVDIATDDASRIYGDRWYQFVADCKAMLGVEAGVSIFDLEDQARPACQRYLAEHPGASFEEVHQAVLAPWDGRIFYRTLSPRHFEAAAFKTCQILFEGHYNGVLQPMRHYIPLAKDFSNLDEVLRLACDEAFRTQLVETAYQELIASGDWTYQAFIAGFDRVLADAGVIAPASPTRDPAVERRLDADRLRRSVVAHAKESLRRPFPGRERLVGVLKPALGKLRRHFET